MAQSPQGLQVDGLHHSLLQPDAPLGTATLAATARVAQVTGGDGHYNYENPMVATDSVTFEVIP